MQIKHIVNGFLLLILHPANAAKILGVFYFVGKSHFIMYEALMKGLADRGHEVHVLSHFPQKNAYPNYVDIDVSGSLPAVLDNITVDLARSFDDTPSMIQWIWRETTLMCDVVLSHPNTQKLLKSKNSYDVVINEVFGSFCSDYFAHHFDAPLISATSSVALLWSNTRVSNPDNPAFVPNYFLPFGNQMSFSERFINAVTWPILYWGNHFLSEVPSEAVARKYFGNEAPPLWDVLKRSSLVFVNSHFTLNGARPTVPAFIEVGGLHINERPQKLPPDIQKFLDDAKDGVIYFSFGSLIRVQTLPPDILKAFLDVFSALPQRVLMKYTGDSLPGQPKNVKTGKWLPQVTILQHPNVKLFISHGGLMGVLEAVYSATPLLGIPFFADQKNNILKCVAKGTAIKLDYDDISKDTLLRTIESIIYNDSYAENARILSERFRDRPLTPLETAVFWTEYVIRHKGAYHMRSAALDLQWYQHQLLDVIAAIIVGVSLTAIIVYYMFKTLLSVIFTRRRIPTSKSKKE